MKEKNHYTIPKLVKGKPPATIPKGSSMEKELAKNVWYFHYSFNGKQYRFKDNINRIKDPKEKAEAAEEVLNATKTMLENGYNPEQPTMFLEEQGKQNITLADAVDKYLADAKTYMRKKTVQSYHSKLRYLVDAFPGKLLKDLTTWELEEYIHGKIHTTQAATMYVNKKVVTLKKAIPWTPKTVKLAKASFKAFLNWCMKEKNQFIHVNPACKIDDLRTKSVVKAPKRHRLYKKEHMDMVMGYLKENDKHTAFIAQMIYYTCLRPKEIRALKVEDINMDKKEITIPLSVMKNTKATEDVVIPIEPTFFEMLEGLNLSQYPPDYFLLSKDEVNIVGKKSTSVNFSYDRLMDAFTKLNLHGKGYTLYGFKHASNIQRIRDGWTLEDIKVANRHSSIGQTMEYLKNITEHTDITNKRVTPI